MVVRNLSALPIVIDSIFTKTGWFAAGRVRDTLATGDTVTLTVSFRPDTSFSYDDTLYIANDGGVPLIAIPLSRNGTITGVMQDGEATPEAFGLQRNFPNPFNPSTLISYRIATNSFVSLKVYDALGREVKNLVNEVQTAGDHLVTFDASGLPSGVYFYRLEAGAYHESRKLTVLK